MSTDSTETRTTQVHRVYIKATAEKIWEAITSPEWTKRYGYRGSAEYDLRPGGTYHARATPQMLEFGAPEFVVDGEVVEVDPPHKLVQTYRMHFSPDLIDEGFTTLTWEIEAETDELCSLTVTHDLTNAPNHAGAVQGLHGKLNDGGGGWPFILSDLKSLLETGEAFEF
jgi:uncharacterized protein YndB with AHSA1/START domain